MALVAMVLIVYAPALRAGYVIDDVRNLPANPALRSVDGLRRIWFTPGAVQQYYPLVYTMYWVESRLWGFHPFGYHLVNVLLHAANVLLVWRLLARLGLPGSWLAAALFAVHPVEVDTVAWISERKNVLSLTCALASLLAYLKSAPIDLARNMRHRAEKRWYALALALFAAALLSKTVVVTLPAVLLVIYWWKRGTVRRGEMAPLLPFFLLALASGLLGLWLEQNHVRATGAEWALTPVERLLIAGRALWFHAGKLVWPYPLMFFYPRWSVASPALWQYLFPLVALTAPLALWFARHRLGRGPLAAVLIYVGVLMPALGFLNVYFHLFSFVADHFQYHASPALFALAGAGVAEVFSRTRISLPASRLTQWPWPGRLAVGALLFVLALAAVLAVAAFHDEATLYRKTLAKNPASWTAYSNLGALLRDAGQFPEAEVALREALRIAPTKYQVRYDYGRLIMARGEQQGFRPGDIDAAIDHFTAAAEISPHRPEPLVGLAGALIRAQRYGEAAVHLDRALGIQADDTNALYLRALIAAELGQAGEAQRLLGRALLLGPDQPELHFMLGVVLASQHQYAPAADRFGQAIRLRPTFVAAWNNRAQALVAQGKTDRAVECYQEVVKLMPNSPEARANLAAALERLERERSRDAKTDPQPPAQ